MSPLQTSALGPDSYGEGKRPDNKTQPKDAETGTDRSDTVARSIRTDNQISNDSVEGSQPPDAGGRRKVHKVMTALAKHLTSAPPDLLDDSGIKQGKVRDYPLLSGEEFRHDRLQQITEKHRQSAESETTISTRTDSQLPGASDGADINLPRRRVRYSPQADDGDKKYLHNVESGTTMSTRTDSQILKPFSVADYFLPRQHERCPPQADHSDKKILHNAKSETKIPIRMDSQIPKDSDVADMCLDPGPISAQKDDGDEKNRPNAEPESRDLADRAKLKAHAGPSASNPSKTAIQPLSEENTEVHEKGNLTEKLVDTLKNPLRKALHIPGMPNPAQSMPSPGIAQLLESEPSPFDENMSFEALMELRRCSFGGSSKSINSLGGPPSSSPLAHVSAQSFAERKPAADKWRQYMLLWTLFFRPRVQHESHLVFHTDGDAIPSSFANKLKGMVESKLKRQVMWWPLSPVHAQLDPNRTLISWECCCGAAFSISVASQHVQDLSQQIRIITSLAVQIPILPTHQSQPSGGNPATRAPANQSRSTGPGKRPVVLQASINQGGNNDPTSIQPDNTSDDATIPGRDDFLHWCVDTSRTTTRLVELPTIRLSDANLVPTLLSKYKILRRMRSWLTLTTCIGVRFIKFRKLFRGGDYVTHLQDELPCRRTNLEYSYQYCDSGTPERDFIRWIQAIIAVRFEYPNCPETLKLGSVFEYIPKKVQGKMQKPDGFGMYAVSAYCFWKAVVALIIASVPSIIFIIRWMIGHQGDWQNALTWLAVTYSLLNILVLQHDRWSIETIRS